MVPGVGVLVYKLSQGVPTSCADDHAMNCTGVSDSGKALVLGQV